MPSKEVLGILLGGILPAILFALSGVTAKYANSEGIGIPLYMALLGVGVVLTAGGIFIFLPEKSITLRGAGFSLLTGVVWALGATLFAVAITKFGMPIAKVTPLNNTSTLFAIFFAFIFFAEWQQVNSLRLVVGATFVVLGSIIVCRS